MASELFFTLTEDSINAIILELRKFFGVLPPYDSLMPLGLIPQDLVYQATSENQPIAGLLFISDEEPIEDRAIPSIILTGYSSTPRPMGFSQAGMKPWQTRETNPLQSANIRCATTQAQVLTTDFVPGQIIDGIVLALNDRVLIANQTDGTENGVYVVQASGAPVRAADFNTSAQFVEGTTFPILVGAVNGGSYFSLVTPNVPSAPVVIGTTPLSFINNGGNILEWDERMEAADIPITIGIRCGGTSQRARLADLLSVALNDLRFVRGQLQKQDVIIQPPGLRLIGVSEEPVMNGSAYQLIYKADFGMTLFQQWNNRVLRETYNVKQIVPEGTKALL